MKYLTDDKKKFFKLQQCGCFDCKSCKRRANGKYVVLQDRGTPSTDGSTAYRIFFVCNDKSHLSLVGYTKPVDFEAIHGKSQNTELKRYDEEEEEEQAILRDLLEHKTPY